MSGPTCGARLPRMSKRVRRLSLRSCGSLLKFMRAETAEARPPRPLGPVVRPNCTVSAIGGT
eukprot:7534734-Pyramimonas_sp.AAC.1